MGDMGKEVDVKINESEWKDDVPHFNIGTIGHVDHGKTTLTSAITKVLKDLGYSKKFIPFDQIDKVKEEKARGITINISHIDYSTKKRHYAHIDCPGHAGYIKNMINGAAQLDGAILVLDAGDGEDGGINLQTKEHLRIVYHMGLRSVVVFVNKVDKVTKDVLDVCEFYIRDLLTNIGFDGTCPIIFGSALCALKGTNDEIGKNKVMELMDAVDEYMVIPKRDYEGPFYMPIENKVNADRGIVVTGRIERGTVKTGDPIWVVGFTDRNKPIIGEVGEVQTFRKTISIGKCGQNVGILLRGKVDKNFITRGQVVCKPDSFYAYMEASARLCIITPEEGGRDVKIKTDQSGIIKPNYQPIMAISTSHIKCYLKHFYNLDTKTELEFVRPGDYVNCDILFDSPLPLKLGLGFCLRDSGITVAWGYISKIGKQEIVEEPIKL